jgi:hypothetical protein
MEVFMYRDWSNPASEDEFFCASELSFGDPDAWRGTVHPDADAAWRAELHFPEWPEWTAGPEYLMWKKLAEGEESQG